MIEAIEQSIFNNALPPIELVKFKYRQLFGLTAREMDEEPIDEFFINNLIYAQMLEKEGHLRRHGSG